MLQSYKRITPSKSFEMLNGYIENKFDEKLNANDAQETPDGVGAQIFNCTQHSNIVKPVKRKIKDDATLKQQLQTKLTQVSQSDKSTPSQTDVVDEFSVKKEDDFDFNADDSSTTSKSDNYTDPDHLITYRVGDWIYCEQEPDQPYVIRKIEEFKMTSEGNLEAKLRCAYRRSDVSQSLLNSFQKRNSFYFNCLQSTVPTSIENSIPNLDSQILDDQPQQQQQQSQPLKDFNQQNFSSLNLYQLKHRELFYSKYTEPNVSVKQFRGKVDLSLFIPDVHSFSDFLNTPRQAHEKFFYQISYDPNLKLISDDRTQIRVGARYQAEIPVLRSKIIYNKNESKPEDDEIGEKLVWLSTEKTSSTKFALNNYFKKIIDKKIRKNEQYSKANSNCEINESRDSIMYDSMRHLNACNYDRAKSIETFDFENLNKPLPKIWTPLEMKQFEQGMNEFGKDFSKIKLLYLPEKPIQSIVEYYYNIWKTTENYMKKREEKAIEKQSKIKEIAEPQSMQLLNLNLNSQVEKCSDVSQNISFDLNEDSSEKNGASNPKALCSSCLKYKSRISFDRNTNFSIFNSTGSPYLSIFGKTNANHEHLERTQPFASQPIPLNDRKNNHLMILKQYETTLNSNGTNNLFDARGSSSNKPQNHVSIYNDTQGISTQQNSIKQETLCNQCWIYWKKFGALKFNYHENNSRHNLLRERICPEKRQERLNAIRNQTFICSVDKCDKEFEFKQRTEFATHSLIAHCLVLRQLNATIQRPQYKNLDSFILTPTALTKKAIETFRNSTPRRANYFRRLARNPTRRTADFALIKNTFYLNKNSKNNSPNLPTANEESGEFTDHPKRHLAQICARPMTPLSPSNFTTNTAVNSSNEIIFSPIVTNESLCNISNLLSVDCRDKSNVNVKTNDKVGKNKRNMKKSSTYNAINQIINYSGECLSPSPSPTTSPSSKMTNLSTLNFSNEFSTSSHLNKSASSNTTDNLSNFLNDNYFKGNSYSSQKSYPSGKPNLAQKNLIQTNTIEAVNALTDNNNISNNLFTLNKRQKVNSKLDNVEKLKEFARMKQKKFILSRLIYFKSNRLLRYLNDFFIDQKNFKTFKTDFSKKNLRKARSEQIDKQKLKKLSRNPFKPSNFQFNKSFSNTKSTDLLNSQKLDLLTFPMNKMIKKFNFKIVQARRPKF